MNELVQPEQQLAKANTIGNRVQEFVDTELRHNVQRTKEDFLCAMAEFIRYLKMAGGVMSASTVAGFALHLQRKGTNPPSIKRKTKWLGRFLRWSHRMGYTEHKWWECLPKIRLPVLPPPKIIRHEEYLRIRQHCTDIHREWLVVLGYNTGMRMGDCCSLRWSHVDQERQIIRKVQNKTAWRSKHPVEIPYISGSDLHQLIIQMWAMKDDRILDEDNYVNPVMYLSYISNQRSVVNSFRYCFDKAGMQGYSFKNFRSTFESRMANSGMNLALAARITGRSDPRALMRYIVADEDAAREGVAKALELHHHLKGFA